MQSKAATVEQYLAELPSDRREAIETVRAVIRKNLDKDYEEGMQYGMIGYYVPHRLFPAGYHCDPNQPLGFICLGAQKNYMSLYMMCVYSEEGDRREFEEAWARTGKKLDMGKSCIRFRSADDLALDVIGRTIRQMPAKKWIEFYETTLRDYRKKSPASKRAARRKESLGTTKGAPRRGRRKTAGTGRKASR
jgi:hypothetical protein